MQNTEVDMVELRKVCLKSIPLGTLFIWTLIELSWYLPATYYGFPDVPLEEIDPANMMPAMVLILFLTNLPDLVSIGIFIKMHLHFKKNGSNAIHPILANHQMVPPDEFGGIWVGGIGDYPVGGNPDDQDNSHAAQAGNDDYQQQSEHGAKKVMKTLKRHVMFCLTDVSILALAFAFCHPLSKPAGYLYNISFSFWVPFYVIKSSFKQLENIKLCL